MEKTDSQPLHVLFSTNNKILNLLFISISFAVFDSTRAEKDMQWLATRFSIYELLWASLLELCVIYF